MQNTSQVDFYCHRFSGDLPKEHRPVLQGFHTLTEHGGDVRGIPC